MLHSVIPDAFEGVQHFLAALYTSGGGEEGFLQISVLLSLITWSRLASKSFILMYYSKQNFVRPFTTTLAPFRYSYSLRGRVSNKETSHLNLSKGAANINIHRSQKPGCLPKAHDLQNPDTN
jgi:hypothetical protein